MNAPIVLLTQRPMVWAASGFALGIASALNLTIDAAITLMAFSFAVGGLYLFLVRASGARPVAVILLFFAAGASWALARSDSPLDDPLYTRAMDSPAPLKVTIEGRVAWPSLTSTPRPPEWAIDEDGRTSATWKVRHRQQFTLEVDDANVGAGSRVLVRWGDVSTPVLHGQRVRVTGELSPTLSYVNPDITGPEDFYRRQHIHTLLRSSDSDGVTRIEDAPWWSVGHWASRLRSAEADLLADIMPAEILPFVYIVWLGERSGIGEEEMERFALAGTAHVLAVSGVHIAIVFVSLASVLRGRMDRRKRAVVLLTFIGLFVLVTGARVSVVRAAIMISVFLIGDLFNRDPDPLTSLSVASLIMLIAEPVLLMNPGFQMSFLSVASIFMITPRLDVLLAFLPRRLRLPLTVALGVQVLSLPVAAATFHVVPLLSPLANLIVVPLLAMLLWLTMIATVLGVIVQPLGALFGYAAAFAVAGIEWVTNTVADITGSIGYWGPPSGTSVLLYFIAIGIGLFALRLRRYRWPATVGLIVFSVFLWHPGESQWAMAMLDVGHGDATVIRSPEGRVVVVDGGDRSPYGDLGRRVVSPFLRAHGMRRIDIMVATHGDRDHIGGLFTLLDHWDVGELWVSATMKGGPLENALIKKCSEKGIPVKRVHAGMNTDLGGAQLEVLHPPADWPAHYSDNDNAIVLRYTVAGTRMLLTADVEYAGEAALRRADCSADIMKAPHHGSNTSSSAEFIEAVGPKLAIASTGHRPGRDPVHEEVAKRYMDAGVPLVRTDRAGGAVIYVVQGVWFTIYGRDQRGWLP